MMTFRSRNSLSNPYFLICVFAGITFFLNLGKIGFLGPDEPRYVQVAREMTQSGDWITPTLLGHTWFEKPCLLYWLISTSYSIFGFNEFAARLPSAIAAILGVISVFKLVKSIGNSTFATWSVITLQTSCIYFAFARAATFEMILTVSITLALTSFFLSQEAPRKRQLLLVMFYVFIGIGLLAKGLIGAILPIGIVILYLTILHKNFLKTVKHIWDLNPISGMFISIAIASVWYGPVIIRHGYSFINDFFIAHHFQRYTSNLYHHPGPIYYYLPVLLLGVFPWSIFLLDGLTSLKEIILQKELEQTQKLLIFAVCWIAVPLIFFSFSGSKLPGYIMPVFPGCAIFIAYSITHKNSLIRIKTVGSSILLALLGITIAILLKDKIVSTFLVISSLAIPLICLYLERRKPYLLEKLLSITMAIAVALTTIFLFPKIESKESLKMLSGIALKNALPNEPVTFYKCRKYSPVFYISNNLLCCDKNNDINRYESINELETLLKTYSSYLVFIQEKSLPELTKSSFIKYDLIGKQENILLIRITKQN